MDEEAGKLSVSDLIWMVLRRKWFLVLTTLPLMAITTAAVVYLPPVYRSMGVVLVETQQIPENFVQAMITSVVTERVEVIRQRVMTREKLTGIADKFQLYPGSEHTVSQIMDGMRANTLVEYINTGGGGNTSTIAFRVGFDHRHPHVAQAVANELITLFLSENVKARTEQASETTEFLANEARKLKEQLDETESQIAAFKQENQDALPEHLDLYLDMLQRTQASLQALEREHSSLTGQREMLEVQLLSTEQSDSRLNEDEIELTTLKGRYLELSVRYQPTYPDMVELRRQINQLEESLASRDTRVNRTEAQITIESRLASIEAQFRALEDQIAASREKMTTLQDQVIRVPQVERGLRDLNRNYDSMVIRYQQTISKTMEAEMAESLEENRKAERFSLIEPPLLPDRPVSPNRKK
ncbi:MAG: hypothetical protein AAF525_14480, partial [Pseudomonadota bacterium]